MDFIIEFVLQGESSFTPAVMIRFFFVILIIRELFAVLHDLIGFCRRI